MWTLAVQNSDDLINNTWSRIWITKKWVIFKNIFPGLSRSWNFQEKIQDFPGGVGTLLRTVASLQYDHVVRHSATGLYMSGGGHGGADQFSCYADNPDDGTSIFRAQCAAIVNDILATCPNDGFMPLLNSFHKRTDVGMCDDFFITQCCQ